MEDKGMGKHEQTTGITQLRGERWETENREQMLSSHHHRRFRELKARRAFSLPERGELLFSKLHTERKSVETRKKWWVYRNKSSLSLDGIFALALLL